MEADIEAQQARADLAGIQQGQDFLGTLAGLAGSVWRNVAGRDTERRNMVERAALTGQRLSEELLLSTRVSEQRRNWTAPTST